MRSSRADIIISCLACSSVPVLPAHVALSRARALFLTVFAPISACYRPFNCTVLHSLQLCSFQAGYSSCQAVSACACLHILRPGQGPPHVACHCLLHKPLFPLPWIRFRGISLELLGSLPEKVNVPLTDLSSSTPYPGD